MKHLIQLCAFADEASPSVSGQIDALRDNNISYLEVRGVDGKNILSLTEHEARILRATLDEAGIRIWSLGSPLGKTSITQDFSVEKGNLAHLLCLADILGAKCIRMFSFYGTDNSDDCRAEVIRRLSRFCDMAEADGIVLCHENEKGIYGETAARCLDIHHAEPRLRAVFDPANFVQCGQDVTEAWHMLAPYVYYGHIKDAAANGAIVPPGDGVGALRDYLPLFAADAAVGKNAGILTLEPHLAEFVGLSDLEEADDRSVVTAMSFPDTRAAFDYAAGRLVGLLQELGVIQK